MALAIGIGINNTMFTAYKGLIARGVEARDASSIVSLTQLRQSGQQETQFSYPDYQAYKQAHTVSGLVATGQQFEQLIMSDAGGSVVGCAGTNGCAERDSGPEIVAGTKSDGPHTSDELRRAVSREERTDS
jgi:hypothetical protein